MINVTELGKWFGPNQVVKNVSFEVQAGEVLGFLGPNGAGKSTTMRMITGYLPPSTGTVTIGTYDIQENPLEAKKLFGYLPENAPAYPDMTVQGFLRFCAEVRGMRGQVLRNAVNQAIATCHLEKVRNQTIDTLSKGFFHRTCFAQAILHDPQILILDEPTDGLDPNQKHEMRQLIKTMGQSKAIIVSTHILEEVEAICSRVIIIDKGRLVFNGTPAEMRQKSQEAGTVILTLDNQSPQQVIPPIKALDNVADTELIQESQESMTLKITPRDKGKPLAADLKALLDKNQWAFHELHTQTGHLDDVFQEITSLDSAREEA